MGETLTLQEYIEEIGGRINAEGDFILKLEVSGKLPKKRISALNIVELIRDLREGMLLTCDDYIGWGFEVGPENPNSKDQGE